MSEKIESNIERLLMFKKKLKTKRFFIFVNILISLYLLMIYAVIWVVNSDFNQWALSAILELINDGLDGRLLLLKGFFEIYIYLFATAYITAFLCFYMAFFLIKINGKTS